LITYRPPVYDPVGSTLGHGRLARGFAEMVVERPGRRVTMV
jgi:hypothetical protein